jgi:hypothetical protein
MEGAEMESLLVDDRYRVSFSVSSEWLEAGYSAYLCWHVTGLGAAVASVHLTSALGEEGQLHMIESVAPRGSREVIFARAGRFTFRLTATFGDGAKRVREVAVVVDP